MELIDQLFKRTMINHATLSQMISIVLNEEDIERFYRLYRRIEVQDLLSTLEKKPNQNQENYQSVRIDYFIIIR